MPANFYDFHVKDIDNNNRSMQDFKDKVLLIVNTASKCGFTPQYKELEELQKKLGQERFQILGFPCNQFGGQEPGNEEEIKNFCKLKYDVSFPMFAKVDVNGDHADPLFKYLKSEATGLLGSEAIKWNFTKFLVDQHGKVLERYAPTTTPLSIEKDILKLLNN